MRVGMQIQVKILGIQHDFVNRVIQLYVLCSKMFPLEATLRKRECRSSN